MRIVALPGGGIKGYVSALFVSALEEQLGRPLHESVDLICGTSTGAIVACGIAAGLTGPEIAGLYRRRGPEIFPSGLRWLRQRVGRSLAGAGLSAPKYASEPLARALRDVLGDIEFEALRVRTLVLAYRTDVPGLEAFKSWRKKPERWAKVWEVVLASAAAPGYFAGVRIGPGTYVDGGLGANDPSAAGIAEAVRLGARLDEVRLLTISPEADPELISWAQSQRMGFAEWARHFLPHSMRAQESATRYYAEQLVGTEGVVRAEIPVLWGQLDDARPANLDALAVAAATYLQGFRGQEALSRAVRILEP